MCRYNSYNKDYGLDVYEGDFIDDRGVQHNTPKKRSTQMSRRKLDTTRRASYSEAEVDMKHSDPGGGRKRLGSKRGNRVIMKLSSSSGSEAEVGKKQLDSSDDKIPGKRLAAKKRTGLREPLSSSSSEFEVEKKQPRMIVVSSDEETTDRLSPSKGRKEPKADSGDSDDIRRIGVKRTRRRRHSSTQLLSSSEEDEEERGRARKHRRLTLESDDEMEWV